MDVQILRVEHKIRKYKRYDKVKVYLDGNKHKRKFFDVPKGEYALVKIESLNDRIAVEEFIENLKK
jgi:hypothetical protein